MSWAVRSDSRALANAPLARTAVTTALPTGTQSISISTASWLQNGPADAVGILDSSTNTLVDSISYADSSPNGAAINGLNFREGGSTSTLADSNTVNQSIARKANGVDTNNNAADFKVQTTITPGAANP